MKIWTRDFEKKIIYIDNNMINEQRSCQQKAYERYNQGLIITSHTSATHFGTWWHEGQRGLWGEWKDGELQVEWDLDRCLKAIEGYDLTFDDLGKRRTKHRLINALTEYFAYNDVNGSYMEYAERNKILASEEFLSYPICKHLDPKTGEEWTIHYCGQVDKLLRNNDTGLISPLDHKTTTWNQITDNVWALSPQFIGYVWLFSKRFPDLFKDYSGIFILDLFQLQAKVNNKFLRREIEIPQWMLDEWEIRRVKEIQELLHSTPPYTTKPSCSDYGNCPYFPICSVPPEDRPDLRDLLYKREIWDIHGNLPVDEKNFELEIGTLYKNLDQGDNEF